MAKVAVGLGANRVPDTSMSCPVGFMVGVWVMFSVVISPVFRASIPVIVKLVLGCAASKPPETHIHHFCPAGNNCFVGNTIGCGVIRLDRSLRLWPSHSDERLPVGNHFSCRDEKAASSDSAAEAITNLIIWAMESMAPLKRGNGSFSERNM